MYDGPCRCPKESFGKTVFWLSNLYIIIKVSLALMSCSSFPDEVLNSCICAYNSASPDLFLLGIQQFVWFTLLKTSGQWGYCGPGT